MDMNKIYNMDCLEGMKKLPNDSIDLTVTSPPYDKLRKYKGFSWDFKSVAKELYRITKPGGVVVWIVSDSTISCVTSPPYFNLRDYGVSGQIGLEPTMQEYIARLVEVFAEVKRVLTDDGTLWVNIADSYSGSKAAEAEIPINLF